MNTPRRPPVPPLRSATGRRHGQRDITTRPRSLAAALLVLVVLAVSGCGSDGSSGGQSEVEVDTPAQQQLKEEAGIDDCAPGPGGGGLPDLTLPCLGGGPAINLASLRGPMLLNIWYSACTPCRQEMPALQEFHDTYDGQVAVLGIDVESHPEAAIEFAGDVGATYPQVADPAGTVFDQADLRLSSAFPQTILIDADGQVVAQQAGEFESADEIDSFVAGHVDLK